MLELVFANLKVRPFRTLISVIGVALGVILVILFTGLAAECRKICRNARQTGRRKSFSRDRARWK